MVCNYTRNHLTIRLGPACELLFIAMVDGVQSTVYICGVYIVDGLHDVVPGPGPSERNIRILDEGLIWYKLFKSIQFIFQYLIELNKIWREPQIRSYIYVHLKLILYKLVKWTSLIGFAKKNTIGIIHFTNTNLRFSQANLCNRYAPC